MAWRQLLINRRKIRDNRPTSCLFVRRSVVLSDHLSETVRPFVCTLVGTDFLLYLCNRNQNASWIFKIINEYGNDFDDSGVFHHALACYRSTVVKTRRCSTPQKITSHNKLLRIWILPW
jgi:hypothetical protein